MSRSARLLLGTKATAIARCSGADNKTILRLSGSEKSAAMPYRLAQITICPLLAALLGATMVITSGSGLELHGHRGARGLAAENTLASFREALRYGVDCIEIDVGMSLDGHLVIHHDRALSPDIARKGGEWIAAPRLLKDLTLAEIKTFDVSQIRPDSRYAAKYPNQRPIGAATIPTLEELLAMPELAAKPDVCLNIEIKTSPEAPHETFAPETIALRLLDVLVAGRFRHSTRIQSFDWRALLPLAIRAPEIPLSFLTAERSWLDNVKRDAKTPSPWLAGLDLNAFEGSLPRAVKHLGGMIWAPYHRDIGPDDVAEAHAAGLKVIVWTVNEPGDMQRAMRIGVDGIITDYPDVGAREIKEWRSSQ